MAYSNGRLPDSALAVIPGTGERILAELLPQLLAVMRAFKTKFGRDLKITDGYRTYDEQVDLKIQKPYLAGTPGTSKHGLGIAVDLGSGVQASFTSPEHLWLRANGPAFGLFIPAWAQSTGSKPEQWHWEFSSGVVPVSKYQHIPGAVPSTPPVTVIPPLSPTSKEDDDMRFLFQVDLQVSGHWYLCDYGRGTRWRVRNGNQLDLLRTDPTVRGLSGPQPTHFIDGLTEVGS